MKTTKAEIKIRVVRTEITINILSTTADNHYSYCRQLEPMVGAEGGRGKRERGEKERGRVERGREETKRGRERGVGEWEERVS